MRFVQITTVVSYHADLRLRVDTITYNNGDGDENILFGILHTWRITEYNLDAKSIAEGEIQEPSVFKISS